MNTANNREHYLDWLRVIATTGVFLFHCSRVFAYDDFGVKNAATSLGATQFAEFMSIWQMPLFFVLSGAAVYYSLKIRDRGGFLKERFFRIMVPWFVTGVFVMAPPQVYLGLLSRGQFQGNFVQFFPHYFDGLAGFGGNFAWTGLHTWYLLALSLFSVILLPFFLPRAANGVSPAQSIAARLGKPWVLPLLWAPVTGAAFLSGLVGLGITRQILSWDILSFGMFFVLGYLLFASAGLQEAIRKYGGWFLLAGAALSALHLVLRFYVHPAFYEAVDMRLLAAWGWIVGFLWLGGRFLNFTSRLLAHVNKMVLPFYIMQQTVIIIVAYFVVQTGLAIPFKYGITAAISLAVIVAAYELVVSRVGPVGFLFGMGMWRRTAAPEWPRAVVRMPRGSRLQPLPTVGLTSRLAAYSVSQRLRSRADVMPVFLAPLYPANL
jgi:glucan biosynthesis protein C